MHKITRAVLSQRPGQLRSLIHSQPSSSVLRFVRTPVDHGGHTLQSHQLRHAHNLSHRYKLLESRIRPQEVQREVAADDTSAKPVEEQASGQATATDEPVEYEELHKGGSKSILRPKPRLFKGVMIPVKPAPPASDECCMSSCAVCVYDLYATALEDYEDGLVEARDELTAKGVPTVEWPLDVLTEADRNQRLEERKREQSEGGVESGRRYGVTGDSDRERQMAVVVGAFVKFERELHERRKAERLSGSGGP